MASPPLAVQERLLLSSIGVHESSMTFRNVTFESERFIAAREQNSLVIVDMASPMTPLRKQITADSAIMCLDKKVIALKATTAGTPGDSLQIFDLDTKTKLKAHQMPEPLEFWKWVSSTQLGMVTATAVYHWDIQGDSAPVKVFDRAANMAGTQIISYRTSPDSKWAVLIGITAGAPERPQLAKGFMQLFSFEQQKSQALEAHAAAFSSIKLTGRESPSTMIAFAQKMLKDGQVQSKVHFIELGGAPAGGAIKRQAELFFPAEFADDFPVSLQISERYGLVYVVTKLGLLFMYDLESGAAVYRNRISADPVFLATISESTGGIYTINRRGQVLLATLNEAAVVPFISQQLKNIDLAMALAKRANLPGAEGLIGQQFQQLFSSGLYKEAAEAAANSPQGMLRTPDVLEKLKGVVPPAGQKAPILVYLGTLLQRGRLNSYESVELARLVINQNRKEALTNWWNDNKLEGSEELGDLISAAGDKDLALKVYQACSASGKVIALLAEKGDMAALAAYTGASGQKMDYMHLLQTLLMSNPSGAVSLAKMAAKQAPPAIEVNAAADLFLQRNMVREATAFLLDVLAGDKPEEGPLQTKLLEVNLITNPQVADAILAQGSLTHYDKPRVAMLCEKAGLYMRALQHYTELKDIKRAVVNTHAIDQQALTEFFGTLSADWGLTCLRELMTSNAQGNLQLVVNVAKEFTEQLGIGALIELFEHFGNYHGLYFFLGSRMATSQEPEEHYKYIEAAVKTGQLKEVERVTRESSVYPPERVKAFLMEAKLQDPRPLINVCDRHGMVPELTSYLWSSGMPRFIEGYVQKVSPGKAPAVVGALLDLEAPDDFITNLITSVRSLVPVDQLMAEVEQRNRLKLLTPFLEHLVSEGSVDPHVHNALGKIVIESNKNPEHFLATNPHYDPLVVGRFCERRDPTLACMAYKRGKCDDALLECTSKNSLFKLQARYVVERADPELWAKVLDEGNQHRRAVLDQVLSTALPECRTPEHVSITVKAFMAKELQGELVELLEKIVLHNSAFSSNANLQNLLVLTAIKVAPQKVKEYVAKLDNFDGTAVAEKAVEAGLADEAFDIFRKIGKKVEAARVLLVQLDDLSRGAEFAVKVDEPPVWSELGHAQLVKGQVTQAIESYIKASDCSKHVQVIEAAQAAGCYADLVKFLLMARKKVKDAKLDGELLYAYSRAGNLGALEEVLAAPSQANLQAVGERCFDEGLYEAARTIFAHMPAWGRLASTLVKLRRFQEAVDAARKANSPKTWKEVCYACVDEREFKLAQLAGLAIVVNADELEEVSEYYQARGLFDQVIALMESGIGLERAHMGIFTELGLLYSKYRAEKLMEHLKLFSKRINIPRLIRACDEQQHWRELTFLYIAYDEYDNAAATMMQHSPVAWEHARFKEVLAKVSSGEVHYRAISFYLQEHPDLLGDLLNVLQPRLDAARVIAIFRRAGQLPLIRAYLLAVQKGNIAEVNEAVNSLLIEEEDYEGLRASITTHDNFDQIGLATLLEKHELVEFRRLAAQVYKKNHKWRRAVDLAMQDKLHKDAMELAAQSGQRELAEELLRSFVEQGEKECFAACLYTCYALVKPGLAMELAWSNGLMEFCMPFLINVVNDYTDKVDGLVAERDVAKQAAAEADKQQAQAQAAYTGLMPLAITAGPAVQQPVQGSPSFGGAEYGAFQQSGGSSW